MPQLAFLLTLAVRVSVVLAGMTLVTVGMRRASATRRHLVWACVLTGVLLMPIAMTAGPRWALPLLPQQAHQPVVPVVRVTATTAPGAATRTGLPPTADLPPVTAAVLTVSGALASPTPAGMAMAVWAAGLLALAFWLVLGTIRLRRLAGQARLLTDPAWLCDLDEARYRLSIARRVRLLTGVGTPVPLTWGTLRPVILLPDDASRWSSERRRVVLLHELAHVKRLDCFTQALARLTRAVHWFNPLVWLAVRQLGRERERACDEMVLASGTRASDYAEHLLSFARPCTSEGWPAAVAMPMARTSQLESRLRSILSPRAPRPSRGTSGPLLVTLSISALVIAVATVHPVAMAASQVAPAPAATAAPQPSPVPPPHPVPAVSPTLAPASSPAPASAPQAASAPAATAAAEPPPASAGADDARVERQVVHSESRKDVRRKTTVKVQTKAGTQPSSADTDKAYVNHLIAGLHDPDQDIREKSAIMLGLVDAGTAGIDALMEAARDADAQVREKAVISLGLRRDPRAYGTLIAALGDRDAQVREKACISLGLLQDRRAMDALLKATRDADEQVREQAWTAIALLKGGGHVDIQVGDLDGLADGLSQFFDRSFTRTLGRTLQRTLRRLKPYVHCAPAACDGDNIDVHVDAQGLADAVQDAVAGATVDVANGVIDGVTSALPQILDQLDITGDGAGHVHVRIEHKRK